MRLPGIVAVTLILTVAPPASAQEWTTYTNRLDLLGRPFDLVHLRLTGEIHLEGEPTMWALEGASVIQVERRGWTKDMIKVGSTIGVRCHQLRDRSSGCLLGFITLEGAAEKMFD